MTYKSTASVIPYYDDFDKTKNYLAMLFNPGRNVQARELTQIQTTLQNQVTSFADHIFRDNSIVVNANLSHTSEYYVLTIDSNGADAPNMVTLLAANSIITGETSGAVAEVTFVDGDNFKIYYKSTSGGAFVTSEDIVTTGTGDSGVPRYTITLQDEAILASCDAGIIYHGGRFVIINEQSIVVNHTSNGHYHIGFRTIESVTTSGADSTLGDPAAGFNNASSPGADRYTVELKLTAWEEGGSGVGTIATLPHAPADDYSLLNVEPDDFVEYMVIKDNNIIKSTDKVQYAEILDLLARRTFDESGNYTITDFPLIIEDHKTDASKLELNLQPGRSYIEGFVVEKQQTTTIDLDKARDTLTENGIQQLADFGQYVEVGYDDFSNTNDSSGFLFDQDSAEVIDFYATADTGFTTILASARVTHISKLGENLRLYLTEIDNSGAIASAGVVRSNVTNSNTANLRLTNGIAVLQGSATSPIIDFPFNVVKTFTEIETTYKFTKIFSLPIVTDTVTITADSYTSFEADAILSIQVASQGYDINDSAFTINILAGSITIQRTADGTWADAATVQVLVKAEKSGFPFRTKTPLQVTERIWVDADTHNYASKIFPATASASSVISAASNLSGTEDGIRIISVTQPLSTASDQNAIQYNINLEGPGGTPTGNEGDIGQGLTNAQLLTLFKAAFRNGQTDYFYDSVFFTALDIPTLKQNWDSSVTDTYYDVTYEYYQHDSGSPSTTSRIFAPDSYPANRFDSIQYYETENRSKIYDLNRCFDFRLKKSELPSNFAEFPMPGFRVQSDVEYYLSRIDKIYLTLGGELGITYGISSLNPVPPEDIDNAMTMYVLETPAYTYSKENVSSTQIDNSRYTMRDIGKLERRLEALEEYSALSLLEKTATDMIVLDANGYDKFKSGLFVDGFSSYDTHNILSEEHNIVIDPLTSQGKSPFTHDFFDLSVQTLTNIADNTNTYTLTYSEKVLASNDKASGSINVNPFLFHQWNGTVTLNPSIDNWFDVNYAPAIRDSRNVEKLIYVKPFVPPAPTVEEVVIPVIEIPEEPEPVLPGLPDPPVIVATPLPEVQAEIIPQIWTGIKEPDIIVSPVVVHVNSGGQHAGGWSKFEKFHVSRIRIR